jgi:esterase
MVVELAATEYGSGAPVAILHGLLGSGRNWAGIAQRLAAHHRVIAFDLRNHGASPWAETMTYTEMAEDVGAAMAARGHSRFALIGHSMGGKVAMAAALADPVSVERLVAVDIAPVAYPPAQLAVIQAMRGLDLTGITRRRDADTRLAGVIPDSAERAFLLQNLVLGTGPPRWRANLSVIEAAMPVLADFPDLSPAIYHGPVLFVAGGGSDYLRPEHQAAILALFPRATMARIKDADHWPQAEQPERFLACIVPFLTQPR